MKYRISVLLMAACLVMGCGDKEKSEYAVSNSLEEWLARPEDKREPLETLDFSKQPLSKDEAKRVATLLFKDKQGRMLSTYGDQWESRLLRFDTYQMPFYYQIFGDEPADGRSLFISLHGGGGTTPEANDQQYENQKHLYDKYMKDLEGVYMALRAPTNTWNLWHQSHIDEFLNIIIQLAVDKENVNPNKVYLLGYSAGGDGLYQLAPRMADRWAAASMMAGHPNDASPLSLRNTPFAIHMGALDGAYDRNAKAEQWGKELDELQAGDPQGYIHQVQLHEGLGHWMKLQDGVALEWMQNYTRNAVPQKIVWKQDDRHHTSFYWLKVPEGMTETGGLVVATYDADKNEIDIEENYSSTLQLLLNDDMLDLDKPLTIKYQGDVIYEGKVERTLLNIYQSLSVKGDINLAFPVVISVQDNATVQRLEN